MSQATIIICTYNRASILNKCLKSIVKQRSGKDLIELIIINNNSTDNTTDIVNSFKDTLQPKIVLESKQGLSYAKNRGIQEATSPWLIFIDDDAYLPENYLEEVFNVINNSNFVCFGGPYYARAYGERPKWIPSNFGEREWNITKEGALNNGYLPGGNFIIKRDVVSKLGGFPTNLGMKGKQIGYGEEEFVQDRLRLVGYEVGFFPTIFIYHFILPHKFKIKWQIMSSFQHGRANKITINEQEHPVVVISKFLKSSFATLLKHIPTACFNLVIRKEYYWQNAVLDSLKPITYHLGRLSTLFSSMGENR